MFFLSLVSEKENVLFTNKMFKPVFVCLGKQYPNIASSFWVLEFSLLLITDGHTEYSTHQNVSDRAMFEIPYWLSFSGILAILALVSGHFIRENFC